MARRGGVGLAWLERWWRRRSAAPAAAPAGATLVPVEESLALLELQICEGVVRPAGEPASAAAARRHALPGPLGCNVFGRPVREEAAAAPAAGVAVATGFALAGLRASVFLSGAELLASHDALRGAAERLAPLVGHASLGDRGHADYHAVAGCGAFQVLASSGQEALDWSLLARWLAERALLPGLVATDGDALEPLDLPDPEHLRGFLGAPDAPLESPTEAQRLLFGRERARLLGWFDPDRPVATGGAQGLRLAERARLGRRVFFADEIVGLARQGMQELARRTGRPLDFVQSHGLDDAELVLVAQGAPVNAARAVADALRRERGWKVGVLGIPWLRPFPTKEVSRALGGRRNVAVVEALGGEPAEGAPLHREVVAAAGTSETWISATCAGIGPDPARLAALCALLRRTERPARVDLERGAIARSGFPRRDALAEAVAHAFPVLAETPLAEAPALATAAATRGAVALLGREAELPPDALRRLAEALAEGADGGVQGSVTRPEPGAWEVRVETGPQGHPAPGPRAPVAHVALSTAELPRLHAPVASLAPGADVLVASGAADTAIWQALPAAWRRALREGELRLFAVGEGFDAAVAALRAWLRGEQQALVAAGTARELAWRELAAGEPGERELPRLVRRIAHSRPAHDSLPRFWGEVVQPLQAGADDGMPDPLLASGAVPADASALAPAADAAMLPALRADACTGCGRCWTACPDAAIGATALGIEPLLTASSRIGGAAGPAADALRRAFKPLATRLASELGKAGAESLGAAHCTAAWKWLSSRLELSDAERPAHDAAWEATQAVVERLEPVVTAPFFREPEREKKGSGELLVLSFDPRACLGCGLCVAVCPEQALEATPRSTARSSQAEQRWRTWEQLPDTPGATLAHAQAHPELGALPGLLLSRHCAQAQLGGAGEPGSGERLAARLVTAVVEQHGQRQLSSLVARLEERREALEREVRGLLSASLSEADLGTLDQALSALPGARGDLTGLGERLDALGARARFDRATVLRMTRCAADLDGQRRRISEGEDGLGRARFGVLLAQGSLGDWAAPYPAHPYHAPLGVAPTAEGVELARGLARGLAAGHVELLRSLHRASLELEAPPDRAERLAAIETLVFEDLSLEERAACPPLLLLADEGALLEQGFESVTRLLASDLPVKVVLLDGRGRLASEAEPALVAMAHRSAFVLATSLAHPEHLARGVADALAWPGPAFVHVHAPSPRRHGFPPDQTLERSRLAVEARAHVLLRYDPRAEGLFGLRASLEGNPGLDADWGGASFADWAAGEERFAEHFAPLASEEGVPFAEWLALPPGERVAHKPCVERPDAQLAVGERVARIAAERLAVWNSLRELTGAASPFTERIRAALAETLEADQRARLAALEAEHEKRLAALRADAEQQALERLTERLLQLSGFGADAPQRSNGT